MVHRQGPSVCLGPLIRKEATGGREEGRGMDRENDKQRERRGERAREGDQGRGQRQHTKNSEPVVKKEG